MGKKRGKKKEIGHQTMGRKKAVRQTFLQQLFGSNKYADFKANIDYSYSVPIKVSILIIIWCRPNLQTIAFWQLCKHALHMQSVIFEKTFLAMQIQ